ncbi:plastocyanin/azurin family copper-binding protein [Polyangium sp. y55x31]|uniref:plastocyanin/azurin family copper-binding protein n=1 Tax=Polyangium sp. y55x31 TaxID=3042688 RepID=UPI002482E81C|nr:plastocyanin/azurin family copper-binding protein [Polyangium sp. y55x31]MDI1478331.1 plastocyanin/azurin family copper-binding protein [Polyangium sp. y55x31]
MRLWSRLLGLVIPLGVVTIPLTLSFSPRVSRAEAPAVGNVSGVVTVLVDDAPKADRSGVVVYLENVPGPPAPAGKREIRQKNLTFTPGLMVIVKGTTVEFPNDDKVFHNVFSVSKAARFDLGLYKSGESKSVTFREAGVVDVYCNIHPHMVTKIKVLDNGFYAVTGADGSFQIKNVPAGTYPVVAWQVHGPEVRGEVTVAAGGTASFKPTLAEGAAPKRHLRKDGTPYGRYK